MAANTAPIYSAVADIQGGDLLTTAAADFTGTGTANVSVFTANTQTGGYVQRLRFKAIGTNVATVARVYINNGFARLGAFIPAPGTPSGTTSTTGGSLLTGTYYAKVIAIDQYGAKTNTTAESAAVGISTPTNTNSITWNWTPSAGAASYRVYVGPVPNGQVSYFTTTTPPYVQTIAVGTRDNLSPINTVTNNYFVGEVSLPATTFVANAATVDVDYPLNFALPPGYRLVVGLGTTVAAGWQVLCIGGSY